MITVCNMWCVYVNETTYAFCWVWRKDFSQRRWVTVFCVGILVGDVYIYIDLWIKPHIYLCNCAGYSSPSQPPKSYQHQLGSDMPLQICVYIYKYWDMSSLYCMYMHVCINSCLNACVLCVHISSKMIAVLRIFSEHMYIYSRIYKHVKSEAFRICL